MYRAISQGTPKEMKDLVEKYKAMGYTRFQLKLGGNYKNDIDRIRACHSALDSQDVLIGDANTGVEMFFFASSKIIFFCILRLVNASCTANCKICQ